MMTWRYELLYGLIIFLGIIAISLFTGWFVPLLLAYLSGLLLWQVFQTNRFESWLSQGAKRAHPNAKGIWEDIYYHVYRLKKREKKRKKRLGKIIEQFRKSTDALPDAAVVLGKLDEIEWVNTAAGKVLGLQTSDRGQRLPNLIRYPAFVRYLGKAQFDEPILLPSPVDGRITLSIRIIPYGAGLRLLLAQDVTQMRKMELMRKDFVANVSHELRTPLTVLKGYMETLLELDEPVSPLIQHSLQQMQGQTERMQHLVDDLLLLSNLETQAKKVNCVDIPELLTTICNEYDAIEANKGRIKLDLQTETKLHGDRNELHSAFTNLVGNALKYSPSHAPVTMVWRMDSKSLIFEVIDQGEGIAELEIPRITERFYRVDVKRAEPVSGTGLGLAIVKHVLLRHDAKLVIKSQAGQGSNFGCYFPVTRQC